MWHIENPIKVFDYAAEINRNNGLTVNAIILREKYDSFPMADRKILENISDNNFDISDIKIKSPNNPAKLLDAKLIKFTK